MTVAPSSVSQGQDVKASLTLKRVNLIEKKQSVTQSSGWTGVVSLAGWLAAAVGAGVAGYAVFDAWSSYTSATDQTGFDAVHAKLPFYNILLNGGSATAAVGLALAAVGMLLSPDVSSYDKQIADIDRSLTLVGAP